VRTWPRTIDDQRIVGQHGLDGHANTVADIVFNRFVHIVDMP
jgi:hypothetical protein